MQWFTRTHRIQARAASASTSWPKCCATWRAAVTFPEIVRNSGSFVAVVESHTVAAAGGRMRRIGPDVPRSVRPPVADVDRRKARDEPPKPTGHRSKEANSLCLRWTP